jgi:hypothetical protein
VQHNPSFVAGREGEGMESNTRRKLNETRFFLQKLEENYTDHPDCDYYLSAFVGAARSVLWVMRNEYHNVEEWESWYTSREPEEGEELFLKRINEVRVRSVKKEPLTTRMRLVGFVLASGSLTLEEDRAMREYLSKTSRVRVTAWKIDHDRYADLYDEYDGELDEDKPDFEVEICDIETGERIMTFEAKLDKLTRTMDEFPDEDALDVCRSYYTLLESLVFECETHFDVSQT